MARTRSNGWRKKRTEGSKLIRETNHYIFCEGRETEPRYFGGFKRVIEEDPLYKDMITIVPCGTETLRVLNEAVRYVKENGITHGGIWCVYDKDEFPAKNFNAVEERIRVLNTKDPCIQYHAVWSNECIELWFVLHFANYTSNNHRDEYIRFLNDRFEKCGIGRYSKNMPDLFDILRQHGNPELACRFARRLVETGQAEGKTPAQIAPGTKVYELVEELAKYLPEEVESL